MTDEELRAAIREHAYLEGDFVLRSGRRSSYYLDKYRFETRPDLLAELGGRLAAAALDLDPDVDRLAGPELGAVALAAAASLAGDLPFLIVRKEKKDYGTENRLEGAFEAGDRVVLVEDVVTSGGAAASAIDALRSAGLRCDAAVCVVDRGEGGGAALAALGVRLRPLLHANDLAVNRKSAAKPRG